MYPKVDQSGYPPWNEVPKGGHPGVIFGRPSEYQYGDQDIIHSLWYIEGAIYYVFIVHVTIYTQEV